MKAYIRVIFQQMFYWLDCLTGNKPLFFENSLAKTIRVDNLKGQHVLSFGGKVVQSYSANTDALKPIVWHAFLLSPYFLPSHLQSKTACILGFGGGAVAKLYERYFPNIPITGVEIDPTVLMIAKKYFAISPNTTLIADDAGHYIADTKTSFDIILIDLFDEDQTIRLVSQKDFLLSCFKKLNQNGAIVINYVGSQLGYHAITKICKDAKYDIFLLTLRHTKITNNLFYITPQNTQTIASVTTRILQSHDENLSRFLLSLTKLTHQL